MEADLLCEFGGHPRGHPDRGAVGVRDQGEACKLDQPWSRPTRSTGHVPSTSALTPYGHVPQPHRSRDILYEFTSRTVPALCEVMSHTLRGHVTLSARSRHNVYEVTQRARSRHAPRSRFLAMLRAIDCARGLP
eukprot:3899669-Rhodomonas_salina.2